MMRWTLFIVAIVADNWCRVVRQKSYADGSPELASLKKALQACIPPPEKKEGHKVPCIIDGEEVHGH